MSAATHTHEEWKAIATRLEPRRRAFIDGEFADAASGETFDRVNPATGQVVTEVAAGDSEDVDRAVGAARRAFAAGEWSRAEPAERKRVLLRLAELIREHGEELALLDSLDMGKPAEDALGIDVPGAAGIFQWYAEAADKLYDEIAPTGADDLALVTREPLGVIGAVVPWNFPLDLATWKLAPALVAGNSVVLKPAEQSPHSVLRLAELGAEAGLPAGVLNVIPGFGETAGRALGLHPDVDCVAFTGSTEVGKMFQRYASESNAKPVWLECGGKSPNLVFADAEDLDRAADMAAFGIFFNQGEVCSANSRLLVERSIRDEFVERLLERARAVRVGDPLDPETTMGPLVDEQHAERVLAYIEAARDGGTVRHGGGRVAVNGHDRCFVEPTVLEGLPNDHRVAQEEVFGPVLAVLDFEQEDEALEVANATRYGLAASIWTSNLARAHRLARRLRVGTVSVNTVDALGPQTPFGGFKESGFGRDLSLHAIDKYTGLKTTWIKL
ncbi:MAG: aldehyde dehydrogenase [Solirubrobacterales bacterium]